MTGWGQEDPLSGDVGHDVNYLSIAGVLWHIGPEGGAPVPPINLLADFGGGGSLVVQGILATLVERTTSGEGQVVDAAMVDGSAQLMSIFFGLDTLRTWGPRGTTSSTAARTSTTSTRLPTASTCRSRRTSPSFTPTCSRSSARSASMTSIPRRRWTEPNAHAAGTHRRAHPDAHERRVGRVLHGPRGVLRADPLDVPGALTSAQRRAQHVRQRRRRAPTRPAPRFSRTRARSKARP